MINSNPAPSFICTQQADGTHTLKIDYSPDAINEEFIQSPCNNTVESYPPLRWLREDQKYRIIIGMKHEGRVMGSALTFVPSKVEYVDARKQSSNNLN